MVTIINYGSGNVSAICNIYNRLKIEYIVAEIPDDMENVSKIILPGVGAFDTVMSMLNRSGFVKPLEELVLRRSVPILGICVGMQVLSGGSEEGFLPGLGWIKGSVKKFDKRFINHKPKIPHLGWNSIVIKKQSPILCNINAEDGFYFIHSYYLECDNPDDVLTESFYGENFVSSVNRNNIYGVQYHPEKSHHNGILLLRNFAEL